MPRLGFPEFLLILGIVYGIIRFVHGMLIYRRARFIADTPAISIRGIPMGLVRIQGKATGDQRMWSPVTHTPCFFYKVHIELGKPAAKGSSWSKYGMDTSGVGFHLEDDSGKVLLDLRHADFGLTATCEREVAAGGPEPSLGEAMRQVVFGGKLIEAEDPAPGPATDDELRYYISRAVAKRVFSIAERYAEAGGSPMDRNKLRSVLEEPLADEDNSAKVADFMAKRSAAVAPAGSLLGLGRPGHAASESAEFSGGPLESREGLRSNMKNTLDGSRPATQPQAQAEVLQQLLQHPESAFAPQGGRFRLTEYCVLPGCEYNVIGTCVENPRAQDEVDRKLIMKGQNEPTYVISDQGPVRVEETLRNEAKWMVVAGGFFAVACTMFLLGRLGQL